MEWRVETTADYEEWFCELTEAEQRSVHRDFDLLRTDGPSLGRPHVDRVNGSNYVNMKELRTGRLRSLFIFDPRRTAIVLVGGYKVDQRKFFSRLVGAADAIYSEHLRSLNDENDYR